MKPMTIYLGFGEIIPGTAWAKITNEETKEQMFECLGWEKSERLIYDLAELI